MGDVLELVAKFREKHDVPILLFGYYNPVYVFGEERLISEAEESGVDGFLVVDLPPEEGEDLRRLANGADLDVIYLLAPTTPDKRMKKVVKNGSGFLYYVCVTGVTGARTDVSTTIPADVARIKKYSDLPVAVGFGISTPDQAADVAKHADAVVVGSALVNIIAKYGDTDEMIEKVSTFAKELRAGIDTVKR